MAYFILRTAQENPKSKWQISNQVQNPKSKNNFWTLNFVIDLNFDIWTLKFLVPCTRFPNTYSNLKFDKYSPMMSKCETRF
jgi:hypothetical protein